MGKRTLSHSHTQASSSVFSSTFISNTSVSNHQDIRDEVRACSKVSKHSLSPSQKKFNRDKLWVSSLLSQSKTINRYPCILLSSSSACPRRRIQMAVIVSSTWLQAEGITAADVDNAAIRAICVDEKGKEVQCQECKAAKKDGLLNISRHPDSPLLFDSGACYIYYLRTRCSSSLHHFCKREIRIAITLNEITISSSLLKIQARLYNGLRNQENATYERLAASVPEIQQPSGLVLCTEGSSPDTLLCMSSTSLNTTEESTNSNVVTHDEVRTLTKCQPRIYIIVRMLETDDFHFGASFLHALSAHKEPGRVGFSWQSVNWPASTVFIVVSMYSSEEQANNCIAIFTEFLTRHCEQGTTNKVAAFHPLICVATVTNW